MSNKINSVDKLPDWFNIDNYKASKNYTLTQWRLALVLRHIAFNPNYQNIEADGKNTIAARILVEGAPKNLGRLVDEGVKLEKTNIEEETPCMVKSLTIRDACFFGNLIEEDQDFKPFMQEIFDSEEEVKGLSQNLDKTIDDKYDLSQDGFFVLEVDLNTTDDNLIDNFTKWLKGARKKYGVPYYRKNLTKEHLQKWYNYGVLPYMDLMYWSRLTNTKIPWHVIGEAVISDEISANIDTTNTVRTTTKKYATMLDHPKMLETLSNLVDL